MVQGMMAAHMRGVEVLVPPIEAIQDIAAGM